MALVGAYLAVVWAAEHKAQQKADNGNDALPDQKYIGHNYIGDGNDALPGQNYMGHNYIGDGNDTLPDQNHIGITT